MAKVRNLLVSGGGKMSGVMDLTVCYIDILSFPVHHGLQASSERALVLATKITSQRRQSPGHVD